jgi:Pathogenicity locus
MDYVIGEKKMLKFDYKNQAIRELKQIPGVGVSIASDLWNIGIPSINDLKGKDPELLYINQINLVVVCKTDASCMFLNVRSIVQALL